MVLPKDVFPKPVVVVLGVPKLAPKEDVVPPKGARGCPNIFSYISGKVKFINKDKHKLISLSI